MNKTEFICFLQKSEDEVSAKMLELLETQPGCFYRDCFPAHFTGSGVVVSSDGKQVLLTYHRFLKRWLQFGGHCDGEENLLNVALRESREESGIQGLIPLSAVPVDLDIHTIPENFSKKEPLHQHYDVRFLFSAPPGAVPLLSSESIELEWFPFLDLSGLELDPSAIRLFQKCRNLTDQTLTLNKA